MGILSTKKPLKGNLWTNIQVIVHRLSSVYIRIYVHRNIHIYAITVDAKRPWIRRKVKRNIWEILEGEKGRENHYS